MIQNERQYKITKTQAAKFRQALLQIRSKPSDLPILTPNWKEMPWRGNSKPCKVT